MIKRTLLLFVVFVASLFVLPYYPQAKNPSLTVSVIDVGQGDSILVQFPDGENMLVDAGTRNAGPIVVNYLQSHHVSKIDLLVASHPHEDHIGGMENVLSSFTVGKVWDSGYNHGSRTQQRFLQTIQEKGIRYGKPKAGFSQNMGQARIDVLSPVRELSGTHSDANNNSVVLRVSYGKISFLLTGDMEGEERDTVRTFPRTTVLKVAHHGSRNGTDGYFLSQVKPQIAVISYGVGNSYGHPHAEALAALKSAGVRIYGTGENGTVIIITDGNTVSVKALGSNGHSSPVYKPNYGSGGQTSNGGQCNYIGNKNSHKFHLPTCSSLPTSKNRVCFSTREEAINQGYIPCKRCNP